MQKIHLDYKRDPKHLARDIERRIINKGYERLYLDTLKKHQDFLEKEKRELGGLEEISQILGGSRLYYEKVYSDYAHVERAAGDYEFSCIRLSPENSLKLANFLKTMDPAWAHVKKA